MENTWVITERNNIFVVFKFKKKKKKIKNTKSVVACKGSDLSKKNFERAEGFREDSLGEMSEISGCRSPTLLLLLASISLQFFPGWASQTPHQFLSNYSALISC